MERGINMSLVHENVVFSAKLLSIFILKLISNVKYFKLNKSYFLKLKFLHLTLLFLQKSHFAS